MDAADAQQAHDPERAYAAAEALGAIHRLFASDEAATKVITGLMAGLNAGQIRFHYGLDAVEYDTARRRMRRAMLRHGLGGRGAGRLARDGTSTGRRLPGSPGAAG